MSHYNVIVSLKQSSVSKKKSMNSNTRIFPVVSAAKEVANTQNRCLNDISGSSDIPADATDADENDMIYHCRCREFEPIENASQGTWTHVHSRETDSRLPKRMDVPDNKVSWEEKYDGYISVTDTPQRGDTNQRGDSYILTEAETAKIESLEIGQVLKLGNSRYIMKCDGGWVEKNPYGRTGLVGKQVLKKYGANYAVDPVITRSVKLNSGKQTQVLVYKKKRSCNFALPGGMILPNSPEMLPEQKKIQQFLCEVIESNVAEEEYRINRDFPTKSLLQSQLTEQLRIHLDTLKADLDIALQCGEKVYPNERYKIGYDDDPRNTDDAWIETTVYHFHISGTTNTEFDFLQINEKNRKWKVRIGSEDEVVEVEFSWLNVDKGSAAYRELYASHKFFVDLCMPQCKCGRTKWDRQDGSHRCLQYKPGPREFVRQWIRQNPRTGHETVPQSFLDACKTQDIPEHKLPQMKKEYQVATKCWMHVHARTALPPKYVNQKKERFSVDKESAWWTVHSPEYESKVKPGSNHDLDNGQSSPDGQTSFPHVVCTNGYNRPRNTVGRTGCCGRGDLQQWGANNAQHEVVTRVQQDTGNTQVLLCRIEGQGEVGWCYHLPNVMTAASAEHSHPAWLGSLLEALVKWGNTKGSDGACITVHQLLQTRRRVFPDEGRESGYCDDPRNTDDAWVETSVHHTHLPQVPGSDAFFERWAVEASVGPELHHLLDLYHVGAPARISNCRAGSWEWIDVQRTRGYSRKPFYGCLSYFVELCVPSCACGLPQHDIADDAHSPEKGKLIASKGKSTSPKNMEIHRSVRPWGKMQFQGRSAVATFVRAFVDKEAHALAVCRLLFGRARPAVGQWTWNENQRFWCPSAIISVTGAAESLPMSRETVKQIFSYGILRAATAMNALIVDGGSAAGVMKEVGDAVKTEDRVTALGVCSWGAVFGRSELVFRSQPQKVLRLEDDENKLCIYKVSDDHRNGSRGTRLDPNHGFFALIDSGMHGGENSYTSEISGRYWIEKALCLPDAFMPHTLVVIGGGPGTIRTAFELGTENVRGNSKRQAEESDGCLLLPVIVVADSGRAADLIAITWTHLHTNQPAECYRGIRRAKCVSFVDPKGDDIEGVGKVQCPYLRQAYSNCFKMKSNLDTTDEELLSMVVAICRMKDRIKIYHTDQSTSLCYDIMKAACTCPRGDRELSTNGVEQLRTAMKWDSEEAVTFIKDELIQIIQNQTEFLENSKRMETKVFVGLILREALLKNCHKFVEVLHDAGVQIWQPNKADIKMIFRERQNQKRFKGWFSDLLCNAGVQDYDDLDLEPETRQNKKMHNKESVKKRKMNNQLVQLDICLSNDGEIERFMQLYMGWKRGREHTEGELDNFEIAEQVFLWAVFNARKNIAEIYWRKAHPSSRHLCIARALFACAIARSVGRSSTFEGNTSERKRYEDFADHFERAAKEIIETAFQLSPSETIAALNLPFKQPLLRQGFSWVDHNSNFLTPVRLAFVSRAVSVVSLDAFQACLARIWYGRIAGNFDTELDAEPLRGTLLNLPRTKVCGISSTSLLPTFATDAVTVFFFSFSPLLLLLGLDDSIEKVFTIQSERTAGTYVRYCMIKGLHKICAFYSAPFTKFVLSFASYLVFIVLYTYVGLTMNQTCTQQELLMHCWIFALLLAEFRQLYIDGASAYFSNGRNAIDILMLTCYIPAFFLRLSEVKCSGRAWLSLGGWREDLFRKAKNVSTSITKNCSTSNTNASSYAVLGEDLTVARSWHGIAGLFFWFRIFDFLSLNSSLGSLWLVLVSIARLDVVHFALFLAVCWVSFAFAIVCATRAVAEADGSGDFSTVIYLLFMELFGEHFLESEWFDSYPGGKAERDNRVLGTTLLGTYLFFSVIILMNLLIARKPAHIPGTLSRKKCTAFTKIRAFSYMCH